MHDSANATRSWLTNYFRMFEVVTVESGRRGTPDGRGRPDARFKGGAEDFTGCLPFPEVDGEAAGGGRLTGERGPGARDLGAARPGDDRGLLPEDDFALAPGLDGLLDSLEMVALDEART